MGLPAQLMPIARVFKSGLRRDVHCVYINRLMAAEGFKKPPGDVGGNFPARYVVLEVPQYFRRNWFGLAEMKMHEPEIISGSGQPGLVMIRMN